MAEYKRFDGETEKQFIWRLHSLVNKKELTWKQVADIVNEQFRNSEEEYRDESAYRKPCQSAEAYYDEVFSKMISREYCDDIARQKQELFKERTKLQTEKLEYNRWLREEARDELITEKICGAITSLKPLDIPEYIAPIHNTRAYALCYGDEHYGAEYELKGLFGDIINAYSPEIFEERMWDLFNQAVEIIQKENIDTLNIFSMGDFSDGILRVSQLMKLRYGVID